MAHPPLWSFRDGSTAQTVAQCSPALISCGGNRYLQGSADVRSTLRLHDPRKALCFKGFLPKLLRVECPLPAARANLQREADRAKGRTGWGTCHRGWREHPGAWALEIETRSGWSPSRLLSSAPVHTEAIDAADGQAIPVGIWPLVCQGIRPSRELSSRRSATGGRCTGSVPACPLREESASSSAAASRGAGVSHPRQCGEAQVPTPPLRGLSGREGGAEGRRG